MQIYNIVYKNRTNEIIELKCTDFTLEEYKKYIVNEKGGYTFNYAKILFKI